MAHYSETFPLPEVVIDMEPEDLGPLVLKHLSQAGRGQLNRYNFLLGTDSDFISWSGGNRDRIMERFAMAWMWLEKELFVAPQPGAGGEWAFITPRGKKVLESEDFETYKKGYLLPSEGLDPILVRKVKQSFISGDYDTAVFQAFKEVEVRVRAKSGLSDKEIGVDLMKKAFGPPSAPLVDRLSHPGEQQARMDLFSGAIGTYKNPSSHRDVTFEDPKEAADIIHIANQLLRIVESIK
ncbi:TIGR02391 family protein [Patescibacteria group bacterium]|nr:TIGR02391 family protein [Patescibacteria group bacterium]MBU1501005.1 TIGR02391 family protein [Patescibacteria group bacterium]MBU2080635.1 TIGR02391 family protein [Patescibacteria group bacterium]MBU2124290.1 TIGR02391 family protein [Patescibacteria group bacterium]MBU2194416.1 TIGR02391 family protein [Patescibacteria group bacterium]